MKRHISILFAFILVFILPGCYFSSEPTSSTTQAPPLPTTTIEQETTHPTMPPIIAQRPMIAASMPITKQEYTADDGTVLLEQIYQNLELTVPDQEIADSIIINFLNQTDKSQSMTDALYEEVQSAYLDGSFRNPYLSLLTYTPTRIDHNVFSLLGNFVTYTGNSHPEITAESITYSLTSGHILKLSDVLNPSVDNNAILNLILNALHQQEDRLSLYENYREIVTTLFKTPDNWHFNQEGVVFYYSPYEIAPYASGIVTAQIEYTKLAGILNDAYFPEEFDHVGGQLSVTELNTTSLQDITQIAEIVCTDNAAQAILSTDGLLENLKIEKFEPNTTYSIFASQYLSPGDAIAIHASTNDSFIIHYQEGNAQHTKTLTFTANGTPQIND